MERLDIERWKDLGALYLANLSATMSFAILFEIIMVLTGRDTLIMAVIIGFIFIYFVPLGVVLMYVITTLDAPRKTSWFVFRATNPLLFFIGYPIILVGGVLGVLNYEIVSKQLLGLEVK